jgi:hypothetical protein
MFGNKTITGFPLIARSRLKVVNFDSADIGDGTTTDPTEEELRWYKILKSEAPEHEKLRRKISVCSISDVVSYSNEEVTIIYDGVKYTLKRPVNSLRIARAREQSPMSALEELNFQRCIVTGAVPIAKDFSGIDSDVIQLLGAVAENFFFIPYL